MPRSSRAAAVTAAAAANASAPAAAASSSTATSASSLLARNLAATAARLKSSRTLGQVYRPTPSPQKKKKAKTDKPKVVIFNPTGAQRVYTTGCNSGIILTHVDSPYKEGQGFIGPCAREVRRQAETGELRDETKGFGMDYYGMRRADNGASANIAMPSVPGEINSEYHFMTMIKILPNEEDNTLQARQLIGQRYPSFSFDLI